MDYQLTLNWPDFIERYWQKRPVVLKRGFANFIDPLSPDELAGLAMESEVDSRLVSHQDGKWQVSHGPFESYDHLSENNWSLLVQAVNHWHEPSAALMHPAIFSIFRRDSRMRVIRWKTRLTIRSAIARRMPASCLAALPTMSSSANWAASATPIRTCRPATIRRIFYRPNSTACAR